MIDYAASKDMTMRFTVAIILAAVALVSGMASADLSTGRQDIVGAWDIFDDGCQSGYLEYRADGGFGQVYRRDRASWIVDPVWGHGTYRVEGDILITGEEKLDGSARIETKQRLSFADHDRMDVARVSRIIAESRSRRAAKGEQPDAAAECIDYVWPLLDISGDGLLSLSEIARGLRVFAKWSAQEQARAGDHGYYQGSVTPRGVMAPRDGSAHRDKRR